MEGIFLDYNLILTHIRPEEHTLTRRGEPESMVAWGIFLIRLLREKFDSLLNTKVDLDGATLEGLVSGLGVELRKKVLESVALSMALRQERMAKRAGQEAQERLQLECVEWSTYGPETVIAMAYNIGASDGVIGRMRSDVQKSRSS